MIRLNSEVCRDPGKAFNREWLETNGIGGFASSTITGLNARRYHGLLVAATRPPVGRLVLLAKLEETLIIDEKPYDLSANQFPGVVHPQGHLYLKEFRLDPFPVFIYEAEGVEIIKSVFMVYGENTTVIQYEARGAGGETYHGEISRGDTSRGEPAQRRPPAARLRLELRPLIAFRDYHGATHENASLNPDVQLEAHRASVAPYDGLPTLYLAHDAEAVEQSGYWYRRFNFEVERARGLDFEEDLFNPLVLKYDLSGRSSVSIIASTEPREITEACEYRRAEIKRRADVVAASPVPDQLVRSLVVAADQYIVARERCKTVIAGYHWFGDWGRDTMIALPGLTLVTGRAHVAQSILREFALHIDRGMLPNRFPDAGEAPEYNTVDATLWYFEAVRALLDYTGDYEFVRTNLYDAMVDIIDWHVLGTRYGIRVDSDGLIDSGEQGVQLTWMDARVGDYVVTPRHGKAVEIQALWYNALRTMEEIARWFSDEANEKRFGIMAARAKRSFNNLFWHTEAECLFDVVGREVPDGSIRPNQILAVSLTHTMLSRERARQVVRVVERELLTPYGLRSLAPGDSHYTGRYEGDPSRRDAAYHQGTVWAWLMGPFITAYIKVNNQSVNKAGRARARAAELLAAFNNHLCEAGLGQVSEIFDADLPYTPRGCIAQAWSVAELLRAAVEDVFNIKPARLTAASAQK
jgi:predicted glycogen debranching enzyme